MKESQILELFSCQVLNNIKFYYIFMINVIQRSILEFVVENKLQDKRLITSTKMCVGHNESFIIFILR